MINLGKNKNNNMDAVPFND